MYLIKCYQVTQGLKDYFFYIEWMRYQLLPYDHQQFMLKLTVIIYNLPQTWVWFQNWPLGWKAVGRQIRCQKTNLFVSDLLKWYLLHSQILTPDPIKKKCIDMKGMYMLSAGLFPLLQASFHPSPTPNTDMLKRC